MSTYAHWYRLKHINQPKCISKSSNLCIHSYANTSVGHWKCMIQVLKQWQLACVIPLTSGANRTQHSTPASRAAERGPGIYTCNYHSARWLWEDHCTCVCVCICVCNSCVVCLSLCGFGNNVTFSCTSINHPFSNSYFGSSLPPVCFDNSAWETQTYSELLPLCLYFSYLHESPCVPKHHWQAPSCVAVNTRLINLVWAVCEVIFQWLALTLGVSVVSSSRGVGHRLSILRLILTL